MQGFELWSAWVGQRAFYCVKNVSSGKNQIKIEFESPVNLEFISPSKKAGEYTLNIGKG